MATLQRYSLEAVFKAPEPVRLQRAQKLEKELDALEADFQALLGEELQGEHAVMAALDYGDWFVTSENGKVAAIIFAGFNGHLSAWVANGPATETLDNLVDSLEPVIKRMWEVGHFNKLVAEPTSRSSAVIEAFAKNGFRVLCLREVHKLIGSKYVDTVLMEKLSPIWEEPIAEDVIEHLDYSEDAPPVVASENNSKD